MNNSKTFLLLGVIVAVLVLGIAYAAIQDVTLTVAGNVTASPDQGNFKVVFTGTNTTQDATPTTATATYTKESDIKYKAIVTGLKGVNDTITLKLEIANESTDIAATLAASATVTNTTYFSISSSLDTDDLAAQGKTYLYVTVTCIKTPVTAAVTADITATVTAAPHN